MSKEPADKEDIAKLEKLIVDGFDRINSLINLLAASIKPPSVQYGTSVSDPWLIERNKRNRESSVARVRSIENARFQQAQKSQPIDKAKIETLFDTLKSKRWETCFRFVGDDKSYCMSHYIGYDLEIVTPYHIFADNFVMKTPLVNQTTDFDKFKKECLDYFSHVGGEK